jgi:hypothetical protein
MFRIARRVELGVKRPKVNASARTWRRFWGIVPNKEEVSYAQKQSR